MKPLADESKREALQEIIHSHGWNLILKEVLSPLLGKYMNQTFEAARKHSNPSEVVAKYDGALELIESIYDVADVEHPENFRALKRNT